MAAPDKTIWGNIVSESTSQAKIGIYIQNAATGSTSAASTSNRITIQVWLASKWSLIDSDYTFYFDDNATSATTLISDSVLPKINVKVATGSGWSDSNQVMLYEYTVTYNRATSAKTIYCAARLKDINRFSGQTMTVSTSYTIPALTSFTVSYNANGGSGAPTAQAKYYGQALTISSVEPSRAGYKFLGWSTSSTATTATYSAGGNFTTDANTNLYAVWEVDGYTVTYNANGGTFSSGVTTLTRTKEHDKTLTIIAGANLPTRTNYTFKGWGTSATSTTVTYAPYGSYTANASITLYAIWELTSQKPKISNLKFSRCTSDGKYSDDGTYFKVMFDWSTDSDADHASVQWTENGLSFSEDIIVSGRSGRVETGVLGDGALNADLTYKMSVILFDKVNAYFRLYGTLPARTFTIDFLSGGKGVAIGKAATVAGRFDIALDTYVKGVKVTGNTLSTKGSNTITSTTDDIATNWTSQGTSIHWYSILDQLIDQPAQHGFLFNAVNGSDVHQLWITQSDGSIYHRGGNHTGWGSNSWREILDKANYTKYCLPLTGQKKITGYVYLNNTVNTVGLLRQNNDWLGFYGSSANAQSNSSRKGWIGFDGSANFQFMNDGSGSNITSKSWTTSSDRRLKDDICDISSKLLDVWKELLPKTFKWNALNGGSDTIQLGLIAQDVIEAFEKNGLDYQDYNFVVPYKMPDDDTEYFSITYDNYHMLTAMVLRETNAKLEDMQNQFNSLKEQFEELRRNLYGNEENAD